MPGTAPGTGCWPNCWLRPTLRARSTGRSRSTPRSAVPTSTARTRPAQIRTRGARSSYTNPPAGFIASPLGGEREPAGHGVGRSRGGPTTKIHAAVDGRGRPLALLVTGGQRNDGAMLTEVLADIRVPRLGSGRPRTRPDVVVADRAYTNGVNRRMLAARGTRTVIPQKNTEIAARLRRGSAGGRAPAFDAEIYKGRNVVGAPSTCPSSGGAWPPATTSSPSPTGPRPSSKPAFAGFAYWETRPSFRPRSPAREDHPDKHESNLRPRPSAGDVRHPVHEAPGYAW